MLAVRTSVLQARTIGERIINKMKEFVEVFVVVSGISNGEEKLVCAKYSPICFQSNE